MDNPYQSMNLTGTKAGKSRVVKTSSGHVFCNGCGASIGGSVGRDISCTQYNGLSREQVLKRMGNKDPEILKAVLENYGFEER